MNKTILTIMMMQISSPFLVPESMLPLPIDEHGIELREEYKGSITASKKKIGETTPASPFRGTERAE